MFSVEQIVGDIVFFSFRDKERLKDVGLNTDRGHFLVKGYDNMGIWVQHPGLVFTKTEDDNGKPLPQNKVINEEISATFLITWDMIKTIMHYPEREGYDLMPEQDCKPVNKYLAPKLNKDIFKNNELKPISKDENQSFEDWIEQVQSASK